MGQPKINVEEQGEIDSHPREEWKRKGKAYSPHSSPQTYCWHHRQFCYREVKGPTEVYSRLQELSHRWLKAEIHTKKQLLTILLEQMQLWVQEQHPGNSSKAAVLVEDFQLVHQESKGHRQQIKNH
uniref:SCAN box domain-containing protein n=1 Tax=Gopherus evgoodei TaxID=1825980 RepID=A0A8C4XVR1_9SAUR